MPYYRQHNNYKWKRQVFLDIDEDSYIAIGFSGIKGLKRLKRLKRKMNTLSLIKKGKGDAPLY